MGGKTSTTAYTAETSAVSAQHDDKGMLRRMKLQIVDVRASFVKFQRHSSLNQKVEKLHRLCGTVGSTALHWGKSDPSGRVSLMLDVSGYFATPQQHVLYPFIEGFEELRHSRVVVRSHQSSVAPFLSACMLLTTKGLHRNARSCMQLSA